MLHETLSSPEARWRPGLAAAPHHAELFAPGAEASGAAVALALARDALAADRAGLPPAGRAAVAGAA